jgi:hypothetical protein
MSHLECSEAHFEELAGRSLCSILTERCRAGFMASLASVISAVQPRICTVTLENSVKYGVCIVPVQTDEGVNALVILTRTETSGEGVDLVPDPGDAGLSHSGLTWLSKVANNTASKLSNPLTAMTLIIENLAHNSAERDSLVMAGHLQALRREAENLDLLRRRLVEFSSEYPVNGGTSLWAEAGLLFWFYGEKHWARLVDVRFMGLEHLPRVTCPVYPVREVFVLASDYAVALGDSRLPVQLTIKGASCEGFVNLQCVYEVSDDFDASFDSRIGLDEAYEMQAFDRLVSSLQNCLEKHRAEVKVTASSRREKSILITMHRHSEG